MKSSSRPGKPQLPMHLRRGPLSAAPEADAHICASPTEERLRNKSVYLVTTGTIRTSWSIVLPTVVPSVSSAQYMLLDQTPLYDDPRGNFFSQETDWEKSLA